MMIELTFEECQDCLSSGAAQIESSSKQRQVLMDASVALSKSVDTFLSTSIVDLQLSMERHEQTRRKLQATEDALLKSRLSLFDAARRARLQVYQRTMHTPRTYTTHTRAQGARLTPPRATRATCVHWRPLCKAAVTGQSWKSGKQQMQSWGKI